MYGPRRRASSSETSTALFPHLTVGQTPWEPLHNKPQCAAVGEAAEDDDDKRSTFTHSLRSELVQVGGRQAADYLTCVLLPLAFSHFLCLLSASQPTYLELGSILGVPCRPS